MSDLDIPLAVKRQAGMIAALLLWNVLLTAAVVALTVHG